MKYTLYKGVTLYQYSKTRARSFHKGKWNTWFSSNFVEGLEFYVPDTLALLIVGEDL